MNFLVFKIFGNYAHFKKYYTTTSPLTFGIPPRTVIAGILGAFLGMDKSEYLSFFDKKKAFIACQINNKITKTVIGINYLKTKNFKKGARGLTPRKQIPIELVKNPSYTIYIAHQNSEIYDKLKNQLNNHYTHFTPYFGSSEYLLNFEFIGEFTNIDGQKTPSKPINVVTVINMNLIQDNNIVFKETGEYIEENMPSEMQPGRIVTEYSNIIYERQGNQICCKPSKYFIINNKNITLL